ncbi:MAG: thiamine phosphate synthase [Acidimicrobiia bacterium]|nr:thiamine phosphate synthase [Acidimicrobiia bacterium]
MSSLSPLLLLTDRAQAEGAGRSLREVLSLAVDAGARAVVVRERDLPLAERLSLVRFCEELVADAGGSVVVASPPVAAGDNLHLRADEGAPATRLALVGRSCHGVDELGAAARDWCDYATLSPIFATASKPGYGPPLGVDALAEAPLPTFALGGITSANAAACVRAGAAGVAVMGAVMGADDPARAVRGLLDAIEGAA